MFPKFDCTKPHHPPSINVYLGWILTSSCFVLGEGEEVTVSTNIYVLVKYDWSKQNKVKACDCTACCLFNFQSSSLSFVWLSQRNGS